MVLIPSLTICSVYHSEESKKLLKINSDLTRELNKGNNWAWIAADNSRPDKTTLPPYVPSGPGILGSYVHAAAINQTLKQVRSRFALILDMDFFIVRPDWIKDALEHMQASSLGIFGAPWHPRWWKKFRYFPAHQALFIDTEKINIADLNFFPNYTPASYEARMRCRGRGCVGLSRDTGYGLYERYGKSDNIAYECLKPVFRPYAKASAFEYAVKKIAKSFLPDRWLYIPKRNNYFTSIGFRELGFYDAAGRGWEEFMWQGRPFGFHTRGAKKKPYSSGEKISLVEEAVRSFLPRVTSGL